MASDTTCARCGGPLESFYYGPVPNVGNLCPPCHREWSDETGDRAKRNPSGLVLGVTPLGHACTVFNSNTGECADCGKTPGPTVVQRLEAIEKVVKDLCLESIEGGVGEVLAECVNRIVELETEIKQLRYDAGL